MIDGILLRKILDNTKALAADLEAKDRSQHFDYSTEEYMPCESLISHAKLMEEIMRGQWCSSSGFLDRNNSCRNPDGCACDEISRLKSERDAIEEDVFQSVMNRAMSGGFANAYHTILDISNIPRGDERENELIDAVESGIRSLFQR